MKSKILAFSLFAFTAAAVAFHPAYRELSVNSWFPPDPGLQQPMEQPASIEAVFVLDTTGSMGGLIEAAKEKIWSIATSMTSAEPAPRIKIGLVAYRDRGDDYVTRVLDLSEDLDSVYAGLMDFQADGGGDGPESVNQALYEAVHNLSWSQDQRTYRVLFLVGDAPPHMDYTDDVKYPETLSVARTKGILVNTIQCGENGAATGRWEEIAELGQGRYFQVEQAGSAVAIATPYDQALARLSRELDDTRIYYGSAEERLEQEAKLKAAEKLHSASSPASRARRATFNASKSGKANFLGKGELVEDVSSGRVDLNEVDSQLLPEPMQKMAPAEMESVIREQEDRRKKLQQQVESLAEQRSEYLAREVEGRGGAEDSLDHKLYEAVRQQAAGVGLSYDSATPGY